MSFDPGKPANSFLSGSNDQHEKSNQRSNGEVNNVPVATQYPGLLAAPNSQNQQSNYASSTHGPITGLGIQQQQQQPIPGYTPSATYSNQWSNEANQRPAPGPFTVNNPSQGSSFVSSAYTPFSYKAPANTTNTSFNGLQPGEARKAPSQYLSHTNPTKRQASISPTVDNADAYANLKRPRQFPAPMAAPPPTTAPFNPFGQHPSAGFSNPSNSNPRLIPSIFASRGPNIPLSGPSAYQQYNYPPSSGPSPYKQNNYSSSPGNQSAPFVGNQTAAGVFNNTPALRNTPLYARVETRVGEAKAQEVKDGRADTTVISEAEGGALLEEALTTADGVTENGAALKILCMEFLEKLTAAKGDTTEFRQKFYKMLKAAKESASQKDSQAANVQALSAQTAAAPVASVQVESNQARTRRKPRPLPQVQQHISEHNVVNLYLHEIQNPEPVSLLRMPQVIPHPENQQRRPPQHPRQFNLLDAVFHQNDLMLHIAGLLPIKDFISLYCISKRFHFLVNSHYTTYMKALARANAPNAMKVYPAAAYQSLCIRDPVLRAHPQNKAEPRWVPGLRWVQMIAYREQVVHDILLCMAMEGHHFPPFIPIVIMKIWALLDHGWNGPRVALVHDETLFPDAILLVGLMFFIKLDMRFSDPVKGNGETSIRRLMLAQRSLTVLNQVLRRQCLTSRLEMLQMMVRHDHKPLIANTKKLPIMGVPAELVGGLSREGWGTGKNRLLRPDELILRECVRRKLAVHRAFADYMVWGYTDYNTMKEVGVPDLKNLNRAARRI